MGAALAPFLLVSCFDRLVWEGKFVELLVWEGKSVLNQEKKELRISRILSILASFLSWFKDKSSCQSLHLFFLVQRQIFLSFLIQRQIILSILASFLFWFKTNHP